MRLITKTKRRLRVPLGPGISMVYGTIVTVRFLGIPIYRYRRGRQS